MVDQAKLVDRVGAYVDTEPDDLHPDVASLVAMFRRHRENGHARGMAAFARAISRRVELPQVGSGSGGRVTADDLRAEIERRNEGRADDDLIVPEGTGAGGKVTKADLEAAIRADDERV